MNVDPTIDFNGNGRDDGPTCEEVDNTLDSQMYPKTWKLVMLD